MFFKFGGGIKLRSKGEYSIPAVIVGKPVTIKTDVVNSDIPLLLSRTTMKNADVKMDLEHDSAGIFGHDVTRNLYHLDITVYQLVKQKIPVENVSAIKLYNINETERHKVLIKLH